MNGSISSGQLVLAQNSVKRLKNFYKHLTAYIIINSALLLFSEDLTILIFSKEVLGNPGFLEWIDWNVYGTPIIWGVALLIHAVLIFLPSPFKNWEENQIKKYVEKDMEKAKKYR